MAVGPLVFSCFKFEREQQPPKLNPKTPYHTPNLNTESENLVLLNPSRVDPQISVKQGAALQASLVPLQRQEGRPALEPGPEARGAAESRLGKKNSSPLQVKSMVCFESRKPLLLRLHAATQSDGVEHTTSQTPAGPA